MWNSAITEPGAGSDVGSPETTYTRRNGKIYLNGSKCFITSSAYTPYIVVMARDGLLGQTLSTPNGLLI